MSDDSTATPIRIVIADDHPVVRDGLRAMLGTQPDFQIVGEAVNGGEALERAAELRPDVVLLDLEMPEMDGVAALTQLRAADPLARVIVLTAYDDDERIVRALVAGAQGYLVKGAPREDIFQAIRIVHGGGSLLQPIVASRLMQRLSTQSNQAEEAISLTARELEVLQLLAQGKSNREIADQLVIAELTVRTHVSNILGKLHLASRTQAALYALKEGLASLDDVPAEMG